MKFDVNQTNNSEIKKDADSFDFRRFFLRILSYWPIILIALAISILASYIYLRYATKIYKITTRVVVNDDTQEKNSNLFEAFRLNYSNTDQATEKELEILRSKALAYEVVKKLQLNIQWTTEGRIREKQQFMDLPIRLTLEQPENITSRTEGFVELIDSEHLRFNNEIFPIDSTVNSIFGRLRWNVASSVDSFTANYKLVIMPLNSATNLFKGQIEATPINKYSSIVDISIKDQIPQRGELFLNTMLEEYVKNNLEYKNRVSENTLKFVDERLKLVAEELGTIESELENFKSKEGVVNLGAEGELFLSQLKDLDQNNSEVEIQLSVLNEIEKFVNGRNSVNDVPPATLGLNDPVLINLLDQLYKTEFELETIKKSSGEKNPKIAILEDQIKLLKPSIINSIKNLRLSALATKNKLGQELNRFSNKLKNIPLKERLLLEISRQQQIKNNIYTFLLQKREESALAAASQVPNIRVIDKPEFAGLVEPRATKIIGIALLIGFLISAGIIYFKEFSTYKILFRDELEKTGLPIIGELVFDDSSSETIVVAPSKRTIIAEQFRELRTNLSYLPRNSSTSIYLLTSSVPSEGKSFIAINLSASIAQAGKKVVLLEFDLRRPRVSKSLNIQRSPGISNYFIDQAGINEIIKPLPGHEGIFIIPSGHIPPNPAELIMNGKLNILIEELKQKFDCIIIDSPPIGSVTDGKLLSEVADATLYVVRQNFTSKEFLHFIKQISDKQILPSINLIFNGVESKRVFGYSYGYGYGYGYGYTEDNNVKNGIIKKIKKLFK